MVRSNEKGWFAALATVLACAPMSALQAQAEVGFSCPECVDAADLGDGSVGEAKLDPALLARLADTEARVAALESGSGAVIRYPALVDANDDVLGEIVGYFDLGVYLLTPQNYVFRAYPDEYKHPSGRIYGDETYHTDTECQSAPLVLQQPGSVFHLNTLTSDGVHYVPWDSEPIAGDLIAGMSLGDYYNAIVSLTRNFYTPLPNDPAVTGVPNMEAISANAPYVIERVVEEISY